MLVAGGFFVVQKEMNLWQVITVASTASVLGDHIGYGVARGGGEFNALRDRRA
jgi:membrane protein DedA with SNARE-associated domain